jgi:hypothetical protein
LRNEIKKEKWIDEKFIKNSAALSIGAMAKHLLQSIILNYSNRLN